jgi:hypothetical protein
MDSLKVLHSGWLLALPANTKFNIGQFHKAPKNYDAGPRSRLEGRFWYNELPYRAPASFKGLRLLTNIKLKFARL